MGSERRSIWSEYLLRNNFGICGAFGSETNFWLFTLFYQKRPKTRLDANCFDWKLLSLILIVTCAHKKLWENYSNMIDVLTNQNYGIHR